MKNIFTNHEENRLRAGWRVFIFIFFMFLGSAALSWFGGHTFRYILISGWTLLLVWFAARVMDKRPLSNFGLDINGTWWMEFSLGVFLGFFAMAFIFFAERSAGLLVVTGFEWDAIEPDYAALLGYFIMMMMVGFYEEVLMRGYALLNISEGFCFKSRGEWFGPVMAVAISSAIFGMAHAGNPNASWVSTINIVGAGIMLSFPMLVTGRLALPVGIHFAWNFFQGGVFGFKVSGTTFSDPLIKIEQKGGNIWTGGAFGPEAGLMGVFGILLIGLCCWVYFKIMKIQVGIHPVFKQPYLKKFERNNSESELGS